MKGAKLSQDCGRMTRSEAKKQREEQVQNHAKKTRSNEKVTKTLPPKKEQTVPEVNLFVLTIDPLKIDLILALIFDFCSLGTLKRCRLVSKRWKELSLKSWRSKAILFPSENHKGLGNFPRYLKMLQFKRDSLQLKKYPFKNFRIRHCLSDYLQESARPVSIVAQHVILCDLHYGHPSSIIKCLTQYESLHTVELENCAWKWERGGLTYVSNVKRLVMSLTNQHRSVPDPKGYRMFVKCFPKVESLALLYRGKWDYIDHIRRILSLIHHSRNTQGDGIMPLRELKVVNVPRLSAPNSGHLIDNICVINSIVQSNFPLERLALHLIWGEEDLRLEILPIFRLLDSYKDKLQYLETSFNVDSEFGTTELLVEYLARKKASPFILQMDALKELHLCNGFLGLNILLGLELPNLRKLFIEDGEITNKMDTVKQIHTFSFPEDRIYEKLDTLAILANRQMPGPRTLKTFIRMMPNLTYLTMPLDKHGFLIVFKRLKRLKSLHALAAKHRYLELDDESLTGIMKGRKPEERRSPNITDMEHLTDLTIECGSDWRENVGFSDHSVLYGFLQLPRLHSLGVTFTEISDEVKAKLENHVKGCINIQVKPRCDLDYYCNFRADNRTTDDSETDDDTETLPCV